MYQAMHTLPMPIDPVEGGLPTEEIPGRDSSMGPFESGPGIDPHTSVDNYNRVMLQYTQRQIEAFTQAGENVSERRTSGNSRSSGQSNNSSITNLARSGTGPPPHQTGGVPSTQSPNGARA